MDSHEDSQVGERAVDDRDAAAGADLANNVPGSQYLGCAFNIFNMYSLADAGRRVFNQGGTGSQWSYTDPTGKTTTFNVPSNVTPPTTTTHDGTTVTVDVCSDKETLAKAEQKSAGIKGSTSAFGASVSASFTSDLQDESTYSWVLLESRAELWSVSLLSVSPGQILRDIAEDPDFKALPSAYTEANAHLFFRFFQKFGTHVVYKVAVGGRFRYCAAVERSASLSTSEQSVNISAEFHAITSVSGDAKARWDRVSDRWMSHRSVNVHMYPGVAATFPWVPKPQKGDYDADGIYDGWARTLRTQPAGVDCTLMAWSDILSGSQASAVAQAFRSYANGYVRVEAGYGGGSVIVNEAVVQKVPRSPSQLGAINVVVLNRRIKGPGSPLQVVFERSYDLSKLFFVGSGDNTIADVEAELVQFYAGVLADVARFRTDDYLHVVYSAAGGTGAVPSPQFAAYLREFGANLALSRWLDTVPVCGGWGNNYLLLGTRGDGARESWPASAPNRSAASAEAFGVPRESNGQWRYGL